MNHSGSTPLFILMYKLATLRFGVPSLERLLTFCEEDTLNLLIYEIKFIFNFLKLYSLRVYIEYVTIWIFFYVLGFWPRGMWNLCSLTRD